MWKCNTTMYFSTSRMIQNVLKLQQYNNVFFNFKNDQNVLIMQSIMNVVSFFSKVFIIMFSQLSSFVQTIICSCYFWSYTNHLRHSSWGHPCRKWDHSRLAWNWGYPCAHCHRSWWNNRGHSWDLGWRHAPLDHHLGHYAHPRQHSLGHHSYSKKETI